MQQCSYAWMVNESSMAGVLTWWKDGVNEVIQARSRNVRVCGKERERVGGKCIEQAENQFPAGVASCLNCHSPGDVLCDVTFSWVKQDGVEGM